jgi:hypothetical protein
LPLIRIGRVHITMKDWHSEEEIKAQLRELTEQTRKLRSDLTSLIRPSKPPTRGGFMHDSWAVRPTREIPASRRRKPYPDK